MTGVRQTIKPGQVWRGPSGHDYRVLNPPAYGWVDLADAEDPGIIPGPEGSDLLGVSDITYEVTVDVLLSLYELVG